MVAPRPPRSDLTADYARSLLDYDPETGVFRWKRRPRSNFPTLRAASTWNAQHAGQKAGWHRSDGYVCLTIDNKTYRAHRVAWLYVHGEWPPAQIDHINGDGTDNRIANLRLATQFQNMANTRMHRDNTSGARGVYWNKRDRHWTAAICFQRKQIHLGCFDTREEAIAARAAAEQKYFGDFAWQPT